MEESKNQKLKGEQWYDDLAVHGERTQNNEIRDIDEWSSEWA
jgi:hypothetical protein